MRAAARVKHFSFRTEQCYVYWIERYIRHHGIRHPNTMGAAEVEQFLTHLAVQGNVSASTQNQAPCPRKAVGMAHVRQPTYRLGMGRGTVEWGDVFPAAGGRAARRCITSCAVLWRHVDGHFAICFEWVCGERACGCGGAARVSGAGGGFFTPQARRLACGLGLARGPGVARKLGGIPRGGECGA
ncbi:MAG: phage integrase N-terminal SAM-like domain-containing protein [Gemmataceae bacterium]